MVARPPPGSRRHTTHHTSRLPLLLAVACLLRLSDTDSDLEYDVGLPNYRPTAIRHVGRIFAVHLVPHGATYRAGSSLYRIVYKGTESTAPATPKPPEPAAVEKFDFAKLTPDEQCWYLRIITVSASRHGVPPVGTDPTNPRAKVEKIRDEDVESMKPAPLSAMPDGLLNTLTEDDILDLVAYLIDS